MQLADVYSAECGTDIVLARKLGFTGQAIQVIPNAGGFSEAGLRDSATCPKNTKDNCSQWLSRQGWQSKGIPRGSEENVGRAAGLLNSCPPGQPIRVGSIETSLQANRTRDHRFRQRGDESQAGCRDVCKVKALRETIREQRGQRRG